MAKLLTPNGVAALWDCSRGTVMRNLHRLKHERTVTGLILIDAASAGAVLGEMQDEYRKRPAKSPGRPREGITWRAIARRQE